MCVKKYVCMDECECKRERACVRACVRVCVCACVCVHVKYALSHTHARDIVPANLIHACVCGKEREGDETLTDFGACLRMVICAHIHICVCIYAYMYCNKTYICINKHIYVYTHNRMCRWKHVYIYI